MNIKKITLLIIGLVLTFGLSFGQSNPFDRLNFIMGEWSGNGSGFGNEESKIESVFQFVMGGKYIEVKNESIFEPTKKKPGGEYHIDKGFISYDKSRKIIVFRQFNNEGYINQYLLNDTLSNDSLLIFETELIENFVPDGKVRWTIKKISKNQIETTFEVSLANNEYSCFGVNTLFKKE